jgi:hypothetical protein
MVLKELNYIDEHDSVILKGKKDNIYMKRKRNSMTHKVHYQTINVPIDGVQTFFIDIKTYEKNGP